jgi:hypothetical protein
MTRWQRVLLALVIGAASIGITVAVATNGDGDDPSGRCETWATCDT